jgi:NADH-quinone oxidoreductase subunit F
MSEHILLRHRDIPDIADLEVYLKNDGFIAFETVVKTRSPEEVIDEVKTSGLRGRGGAGFPAGVKWSFLSPGVFPRYVVANADESEPGTFKDREIMEGNPFQFLEGVAICSYAAQANAAYVYCRGEFWDLAHVLEQKIGALYEEGYLGKGIFGTDYDLDIFVHVGAGAYICGEETALLDSLEGKLGQPRLRPPFPAAEGLFAKPTVVNNVETLTNLPPIINQGGDWYRTIGIGKSTGPKVFCLSGQVERPGNYELPLGTPFRELIFELGGGMRNGKAIKAILPAGASSAILPATDEVLDTPMDYESIQEVGSQLGSASVIVVDESVNLAWLAYKTTSFFKHESCGKCTPCREGTYWMYHILERIVHGQGEMADIDLLDNVAGGIEGKCLCALGEFSIMPILTAIRHFRPDFEAYVGGTQ